MKHLTDSAVPEEKQFRVEYKFGFCPTTGKPRIEIYLPDGTCWCALRFDQSEQQAMIEWVKQFRKLN